MNIIKPERIRLPYPFLYLKPEKCPFWVDHPRMGHYMRPATGIDAKGEGTLTKR